MAKNAVSIMLDKERFVRLGMKAIDRIEDHFKCPMAKINFENLTSKDFAYILWSGLLHEDANLKIPDVMDLVDEYTDMKTAYEVITAATEANFGKAPQGNVQPPAIQEAETEPEEEAEDGTGTKQYRTLDDVV